jgi:hypothetical protein
MVVAHPESNLNATSVQLHPEEIGADVNSSPESRSRLNFSVQMGTSPIGTDTPTGGSECFGPFKYVAMTCSSKAILVSV